jgi:hypothetical protein
MSARKRSGQSGSAARRVRTVASSVLPLARRGVHRTRAWAAPNVERTGRVLQDSVAPKVTDALSAAARHIDPDTPRRKRWRKQASIAALTAAAGGAIAGLARRARNSNPNGVADGETSVRHAADKDAASAEKT